ncbi:MAG: hypothetical protein P1U68_17605 [Verrucomicrobiales bacterium]|nr:hypothetical protein [Verrucomicrobiales bacterium]
MNALITPLNDTTARAQSETSQDCTLRGLRSRTESTISNDSSCEKKIREATNQPLEALNFPGFFAA